MAKIRTGKVMAFLKVYKEFITRIIPGFRGVPRAWLPPLPRGAAALWRAVSTA